MIVAIRDDDTSFWTNPEELEKVYGGFFRKGGKVSLAVVPCSWKQVNPGIEQEFYIDEDAKRMPIYENKRLIDYLLEKIRQNQVEIMQHGYDHSYGVYLEGRKKFLTKDVRLYIRTSGIKNYKYLPECVFKSMEELESDLRLGKEILEDTFKTKVRIFVPPGNALSKEAAEIVANLGMNISGIIEKKFNRPVSFGSIINYAKRAYWKIKYNRPYPFIMDYGTHKELVAYAFTPSTDLGKLSEIFEFCKKKKAPFVLATHYWEILRDSKLRDNFYFFLEKLRNTKILLLHQLIDNGS